MNEDEKMRNEQMFRKAKRVTVSGEGRVLIKGTTKNSSRSHRYGKDDLIKIAKEYGFSEDVIESKQLRFRHGWFYKVPKELGEIATTIRNKAR